MSKNGLHLITPTSIASTGTGNSSSISANGSVTFSSCATLSLNGVFSADYDNYMIVLRHTDDGNTGLRLRASGTDNSTSNSYVSQLLNATGTTVSGSRATTNHAYAAYGLSTTPNGNVISMYGPHLSQPTAARSVNVNDDVDARIVDWAWTHNQSTSYDGFTLICTAIIVGSGSVTMSGRVAVYGMRK